MAACAQAFAPGAMLPKAGLRSRGELLFPPAPTCSGMDERKPKDPIRHGGVQLGYDYMGE
jgi:hypothetical protein